MQKVPEVSEDSILTSRHPKSKVICIQIIVGLHSIQKADLIIGPIVFDYPIIFLQKSYVFQSDYRNTILGSALRLLTFADDGVFGQE